MKKLLFMVSVFFLGSSSVDAAVNFGPQGNPLFQNPQTYSPAQQNPSKGDFKKPQQQNPRLNQPGRK